MANTPARLGSSVYDLALMRQAEELDVPLTARSRSIEDEKEQKELFDLFGISDQNNMRKKTSCESLLQGGDEDIRIMLTTQVQSWEALFDPLERKATKHWKKMLVYIFASWEQSEEMDTHHFDLVQLLNVLLSVWSWRSSSSGGVWLATFLLQQKTFSPPPRKL
jgi:hypothetical protein